MFAPGLSISLSVPASMTTSVTQKVPVGQVHLARRMREGVVHHDTPPLLSGDAEGGAEHDGRKIAVDGGVAL